MFGLRHNARDTAPEDAQELLRQGHRVIDVLATLRTKISVAIDGTRMEITNPLAMLALIDSDEVCAVAGEAHERLQRVAAALSNQKHTRP